ncbi:MAG: YCF48-related protein [Flavobacteriales bacterium]
MNFLRDPLFLFSFIFLLGSAQAQQWELVTPIKDRSDLVGIKMTDPVTGFMIDRSIGAFYSTHDGGIHWDRKASNLGTSSPKALWMWDNDRGVIAANSGRFYLTMDGFNTINTVFTTFGNASCIFFIDDLLGFAGTETGKILRTTDGGATWLEQTSGITTNVNSIYFVNSQLGFASALGSFLLRSTDGGTTWQQLTPPDVVNIKDLHFFDAQNGIGVGSVGHIVRTTDGGDSWTFVTSPTTYNLNDLEVNGNALVACGAWGRVIRSTNGGTTWLEATVDAREHFSTSFSAGGIGLMASSGAVYRSTDMGATWGPVYLGTQHSLLTKTSFANDQIGVAIGYATSGGFDAGFLRTDNGGRSWAKLAGGGLGVHLRSDGAGARGGSSGSNAHTADFFVTSQAGSSANAPQVAIRCVHSFSPTNYIVAGGNLNGGFYRTSNGGTSWTYTAASNPYDMYFPTEQVGYAVGEGSQVYKTTDAGITWTDLGNVVPSQQHTVFFLDEMTGWTGGAGAGSRTTDGGATWTTMGDIPSYTMSIIFTDADTGYAVGNTGQVVRSVDGGATWVNFIPDIFNALIGDAAWVDGALVAVGRFGDIYRAQIQCSSLADIPVLTEVSGTLYSNSPEGNQWYFGSTPIPGETGAAFAPTSSGSYHVVVTDALGCVSAASNSVMIVVTTVDEARDRSTLQLYPNPTQTETTLTLPTEENGSAEVLDLHGRIVHQSPVRQGRGRIDLSELPSGVYAVRCIIGDHAFTGRVVKE